MTHDFAHWDSLDAPHRAEAWRQALNHAEALELMLYKLGVFDGPLPGPQTLPGFSVRDDTDLKWELEHLIAVAKACATEAQTATDACSGCTYDPDEYLP